MIEAMWPDPSDEKYAADTGVEHAKFKFWASSDSLADNTYSTEHSQGSDGRISSSVAGMNR